MNILVTGAGGFLGGHVCRRLVENGYSVIALVKEKREYPLLKINNIEFLYGDITNISSLKGAVDRCEAVFHLAAVNSFDKKDKNLFYKVNVGGTNNVLQLLKGYKDKRLVFTSTRGTLGHRPNFEPVNELDTATPEDLVDDYLKSKFIAEKNVAEAIERGLDGVIVNPTALIGPFDIKPSPIGKIILSLLQNKLPVYVGGGINLVDVRDVAMGHVLAFNKGKTGERYILGKITKITPLISSAKIKTAKLTNFSSIEKAQKYLDYQPISINDTIKDTIKWFKEENRL